MIPRDEFCWRGGCFVVWLRLGSRNILRFYLLPHRFVVFDIWMFEFYLGLDRFGREIILGKPGVRITDSLAQSCYLLFLPIH